MKPKYMGSYYLSDIFHDYDHVINRLCFVISTIMGQKEYSIVSSGLSGDMLVLAVANKLDKPATIVRKTVENTHGILLEGYGLRDRYIFIDDLVGTGRTAQRVIDSIKKKRRSVKPECTAIFLWSHNGLAKDAARFVRAMTNKDIPVFSWRRDDPKWSFRCSGQPGDKEPRNDLRYIAEGAKTPKLASDAKSKKLLTTMRRLVK